MPPETPYRQGWRHLGVALEAETGRLMALDERRGGGTRALTRELDELRNALREPLTSACDVSVRWEVLRRYDAALEAAAFGRARCRQRWTIRFAASLAFAIVSLAVTGSAIDTWARFEARERAKQQRETTETSIDRAALCFVDQRPSPPTAPTCACDDAGFCPPPWSCPAEDHGAR